MVHFFRADPSCIRFAIDMHADGDCRLAIHHSTGVIHESYSTPAMALRRVQELEDLLAHVSDASSPAF
jgi:hypothetical protein